MELGPEDVSLLERCLSSFQRVFYIVCMHRLYCIIYTHTDCQFSCSGHGSCDQRTKRCHCDVFWMENPFTAHTGRHESNCGEFHISF